MRAQLQKGNRPREAASDIHKSVDQAAATQPWDCETLKPRANGDLEGGPLDNLGASPFCNLEDAHRFISNSGTLSQGNLLQRFVTCFPLRRFCSSSGKNHPNCFSSKSLKHG